MFALKNLTDVTNLSCAQVVDEENGRTQWIDATLAAVTTGASHVLSSFCAIVSTTLVPFLVLYSRATHESKRKGEKMGMILL